MFTDQGKAMETVVTDSPERAAEFIRRGGLAAFPTETVYGLGAGIFDEKAVAGVFRAKSRPADNPLIAHVSDPRQIRSVASRITDPATKFIDAFFPGPLTVILPKSEDVPSIATAGLDTIGVRMPDCRIALEFIGFAKTPVVAPSANISGRPSPTTWKAVLEDLDGRIDCILRGDATRVGLESTVVDCSGIKPTVLRAGGISVEELIKIVPETRMATNGSARVRSPGSMHTHYTPSARVVLIAYPSELERCRAAGFIGLDIPGAEPELAQVCGSVEEYAFHLFDFFRKCDRRGIKTIYCQQVDETGLGVALMDRLRRAAAAS